MKNDFGSRGMPTLRLGSAFCLLVLIAGLAACGGDSLSPLQQTLTPLSASVRGTATARSENLGSSDTLQTAVAVATELSAQIYATQTAQAALSDSARLATVTAMAPVVAELPLYGVDPAAGYVAWMHNPLTIDLDGYMTSSYANDYPLITAADFVLVSDITWNAVGSLSGCGFMFRSNGDEDEPDLYSVLITRTANGYLAFTATANGELANFHYFYPRDVDRSFSWFNEATNRLAVVARGDLISLYTNGNLIAEVNTHDPPQSIVTTMPESELPPGASPEQVQDYMNMAAQYGDTVDNINSQIAEARANFATLQPFYTDGLLGFMAMNQSGSSTCTFENAWLFILNP